MASSRSAFAAGVLVLAPRAWAESKTSTEKGACEFANEPLFPGYFWDPMCKVGMEGCLADGRNIGCRFCGGGDYSTPCPASSCHFPGGEPFVPYYWDPECEMGKLGCWADGIHRQCRFCGEYPYTSIECPERLAAPPQGAACAFTQKTETPHFWDPACKNGMHGCFADGVHEQCRFCGAGVYSDIQCPASKVCTFANEPVVPYFWDPECAMGKLGCNADGVHVQCRFCAVRPFEDIACPEEVAPPKNKCIFPLHGEPATPHYWEPRCVAGVLGCWADGLHAECRFCGQGVFENITCLEAPAETSPAPHAPPAAPKNAPAAQPATQPAGPPAAEAAGEARADEGHAQAGVAHDALVAKDLAARAEDIQQLSGSRRRVRDMAAGAAACWAVLAATRAA